MTKPGDAISFVLTSCGRFDLLEETLRTFFELNSAHISHYIVIEDSGDESVRKVLDQFSSSIELIVNKPRLGQARSIDRAYARVETPYIFHCEDDWRFFRSGFIEESLELLKARPELSVISCRDISRKEDLKSILGEPVKQAAGVSYRTAHPGRSRLFDGYTFNPGLRRLKDVEVVGSFGRWQRESDISLCFVQAGMMIGYLANAACDTTGRNNRLPKVYERRPIAIYPRRLRSFWDHFVLSRLKRLFARGNGE